MLGKEDFLALAGAWYDQHYPALYEHYSKYGKGKAPIPIPSRANVLDEYYDTAGVWREYKRVSQQLRTYRNRIVHDVAVGHIAVGSVNIVPRKRVIHEYRLMADVRRAATDGARLRKDFVVREQQMHDDFFQLQESLNAIWEKPLADLQQLLYEEHNDVLMQKYDLLFAT